METNHNRERPCDAEFDKMFAGAQTRIHQTIQLQSRPWWRKLSRLTSVTVILLGAGGIAGGAYAANLVSVDSTSSTRTHSLPTPPLPAAPPKVGEPVTIGPWQKDRPAPDLVPIDLKDGRSGFLRTYDLAFGSRNPKFSRKTGKHSEETVLPVYAKDGQTVIGEFVAGTSSSK